MKKTTSNRWDVGYRAAVEIQNRLRNRVKIAPFYLKAYSIAGADIAYDTRSDRIFAGVIVLDYPSLAVIEKRSISEKASFPYIPGLLSFREIPPLLKVLEMLKTRPDVIICDGQGIAHPRRFGLASHLGVLLGIPTIGCAKSLLIGEFTEPADRKGAFSVLTDKGEVIGSVLRTRKGVKPVFVSPGHLVDFVSARRVVLETCTKYRIPELTRQAHILVNHMRKKVRGVRLLRPPQADSQ